MFTPLTLQIARASRPILRHWCQRCEQVRFFATWSTNVREKLFLAWRLASPRWMLSAKEQFTRSSLFLQH